MNKRDKFYDQVLTAINQYRSVMSMIPLRVIPMGAAKSCDSTAPMVKALGRFIEPFSNNARLYWITFEDQERAEELVRIWNTNVQKVTLDKKPQYRVFLPESMQQFLSEWFQGKHRRFWSK